MNIFLIQKNTRVNYPKKILILGLTVFFAVGFLFLLFGFPLKALACGHLPPCPSPPSLPCHFPFPGCHPSPSLHAISGMKFNDLNQNGENNDEPGLQGWTITISKPCFFKDSTITDEDGNYSFSGLYPGTYTICEVQQEGWEQSYPEENDGCHIVEIEDEDIEDLDFGNYLAPYCGDGILDEGEECEIGYECQCDKGYTCNLDTCLCEEEVVEPVCGNGIPEEGEECDLEEENSDEPGSTCSTQCLLRDICQGADLILDLDPLLWVVGENCHPSNHIEDSIDADIPWTANGDVYGRSLRGNIDQYQTNEVFYLDINSANGPVSPDDPEPEAITTRFEHLGNFPFDAGLTTIYMKTGSTCPPDDSPGSVRLDKLCIYLEPEEPEPICGNGILEEGEGCEVGQECLCQQGYICNLDTCLCEEVIEPVCGNGILEEDEECDDGNTENGDGCSSQCQLEICDPEIELVVNNGFETPIVDTPQDWDIFNSSEMLGWDVEWVSLTPSIYKGYDRPIDAYLELQAGVNSWSPFEGEQYAELDADWDGPGGSLSGEPASVRIYQDISTIPGQEYDVSFYFSPRPQTNNENNRLEFKWDGIVIDDTITGAGENNTTWTKYEYTLTATGDTTRIEFTDIGNPSDSLGTLLDNVSVRCKPYEEPVPVCGNGVKEGDEECDDSNTEDGDGCSAVCTIELPPEPVCGNNILEGEEECDDGNIEDGDGCSATCAIELPPEPICGNGTIEGEEECDDGNTEDGDGCSAVCAIEPSPEPVCGNGITESGEECDDGNTASGDGCSASCVTESLAVGGGGGGGGARLRPVLRIEKSSPEASFSPGSTILYIITIKNTGSTTAYDVVLTDNLPDGFTYSDTGLSTREWELGSIGVGISKEINYEVIIGGDVGEGAYVNTASVNAKNHKLVSDDAIVSIVLPVVLGEEVEKEVVPKEEAIPEEGEIGLVGVSVEEEEEVPEEECPECAPCPTCEVPEGWLASVFGALGKVCYKCLAWWLILVFALYSLIKSIIDWIKKRKARAITWLVWLGILLILTVLFYFLNYRCVGIWVFLILGLITLFIWVFTTDRRKRGLIFLIGFIVLLIFLIVWLIKKCLYLWLIIVLLAIYIIIAILLPMKKEKEKKEKAGEGFLIE